MLEDRNLKLDVMALALLALVVFLTVSLATYHHSDPPSTLVYPTGAQVANACGRSGALAAQLALQGLGLGAYYLVFSAAVLDVLLLVRRPIDQCLVRCFGWLLSLLGLTTLVALVSPQASPGPVIGAGGYLGAAGCGFLQMHFAAAGTLILTLSIIMAGLLLCTDYVLLRYGAHAVEMTAYVLAVIGDTLRSDSGGRRKEADEAPAEDDEEEVEEDEEEEEEEEEDDPVEDEDRAEPSVRFRGTATGVDRNGDDAEQDDGQAGQQQPGRAGRGGVGRRLASALRLAKPSKDERDEVMETLDAASRSDEPVDYELPSIDLLLQTDSVSFEAHEKEVRRKAKILEKTFDNFGYNIRVVEIETGPVIAQYEVELEAGLRLSKITGLADDLAVALRVPSVRIVAPIPGKNTVGIEVPNDNRQLVRLREVIEEANGRARRMKIPVFLGKDVAGNAMLVDLAILPHLLIAGRTGTGKSVCLNSIIASILMTRRPDEVRMLMIDPKMVELSPYRRLPHLMHPVVTDMRKAEAILAWAVEKMEERYGLLARAGVRHVAAYNQLGDDELRERMQPETDEEWNSIPKQMPFVIIVADEMADLMMVSGKEVEQHIIRLAQKSRAVGIHLILATQKPTVDVITGLIKSNLPARISFQVASRTDSRVVLDEMGADKLLGNGDMLFLLPGTSTLLRGQGTYLSDDEINGLVDFVGTSQPQFVKELVQLQVKDQEAGGPGRLSNRDELYESAVDVVVREGRGSVSLLQRTLGIGYGRAARLIDYMAEDEIVGSYNGSQAREVLMSLEEWQAVNGEQTEPAVPAPSQSNRIAPEPSAPAAATMTRKQLGHQRSEPDDGHHDQWADQRRADGPAAHATSGDEQDPAGGDRAECHDTRRDETEGEDAQYDETEYEQDECVEDEHEEDEYEEEENDEYAEDEYEEDEQGEEDEYEEDEQGEEDEYEEDQYVEDDSEDEDSEEDVEDEEDQYEEDEYDEQQEYDQGEGDDQYEQEEEDETEYEDEEESAA